VFGYNLADWSDIILWKNVLNYEGLYSGLLRSKLYLCGRWQNSRADSGSIAMVIRGHDTKEVVT
jgi:hypothetical protein